MHKLIKISDQFAVICFPGEQFADFLSVDDRLTAEGFDTDRRTTKEELFSETFFVCGKASRFELLENESLRWVFCSDAKSTRDYKGVLGLPIVILDHFHQGLLCFNGNIPHSADFRDRGGFLIRL